MFAHVRLAGCRRATFFLLESSGLVSAYRIVCGSQLAASTVATVAVVAFVVLAIIAAVCNKYAVREADR